MKRGEVWWANLPLPRSRRPVLLLSRSEAFAFRTSLTVAPCTTTIRDIPVEVRLGSQHGMPRDCVVNFEAIQTIRKSSLVRMLTVLPPEVMAQVDRAIKFALALR